MEVEREDPGVRRSEATMLGEGAVAQVFALRALAERGLDEILAAAASLERLPDRGAHPR